MITREEAEQGNEDLQREIQNILWWMFYADAGPRYAPKAVAAMMNIAPDTLYKYIRGSLPLPYYHGPGLLRATGDRMLLEWLTKRCPGLIISELGRMNQPNGDIEDDVENVTLAALELFREKVETMRDRVVDGREQGKLLSLASQLRDVVDGLILEIQQMAIPERKTA
jgi:hypothetical protein